MRRSWPRYVFVTPQGTGLTLPCLTLLPPRVFSAKLVKWVVMYCSNGYLRQYVCVCMDICVLKVHNAIMNSISVRQDAISDNTGSPKLPSPE